jgi:hypothetical protein
MGYDRTPCANLLELSPLAEREYPPVDSPREDVGGATATKLPRSMKPQRAVGPPAEERNPKMRQAALVVPRDDGMGLDGEHEQTCRGKLRTRCRRQ